MLVKCDYVSISNPKESLQGNNTKVFRQRFLLHTCHHKAILVKLILQHNLMDNILHLVVPIRLLQDSIRLLLSLSIHQPNKGIQQLVTHHLQDNMHHLQDHIHLLDSIRHLQGSIHHLQDSIHHRAILQLDILLQLGNTHHPANILQASIHLIEDNFSNNISYFFMVSILDIAVLNVPFLLEDISFTCRDLAGHGYNWQWKT
jgi:hypothetical protein